MSLSTSGCGSTGCRPSTARSDHTSWSSTAARKSGSSKTGSFRRSGSMPSRERIPRSLASTRSASTRCSRVATTSPPAWPIWISTGCTPRCASRPSPALPAARCSLRRTKSSPQRAWWPGTTSSSTSGAPLRRIASSRWSWSPSGTWRHRSPKWSAQRPRAPSPSPSPRRRTDSTCRRITAIIGTPSSPPPRPLTCPCACTSAREGHR